jgi:hypothetical protein
MASSSRILFLASIISSPTIDILFQEPLDHLLSHELLRQDLAQVLLGSASTTVPPHEHLEASSPPPSDQHLGAASPPNNDQELVKELTGSALTSSSLQHLGSASIHVRIVGIDPRESPNRIRTHS